MSEITDLLIEYQSRLLSQDNQQNFLNTENLAALEQALQSLSTSTDTQEDTQAKVAEDQQAFGVLQNMLIDGHANLADQSETQIEGGGAGASSALVAAPSVSLAPGLSRQVSTNLADMSEELELRLFGLSVPKEEQEEQADQDAQSEHDDVVMGLGLGGGAAEPRSSFGFGGAGASALTTAFEDQDSDEDLSALSWRTVAPSSSVSAAAAPAPSLYPGAMSAAAMPPPPPAPSLGSLSASAAPAGASGSVGFYPGALNVAAPTMQRNVAQRQTSFPVAASLGAENFAAPSLNRGLSSAAANPEVSALSSDEEEESQAALVPSIPAPIQPRRGIKRQATHFNTNPPVYSTSQLNTPARYTQSWLRQAARILSIALPQRIQVADILFAHLSNNRVGVSDNNVYIFDVLKFASSDIEGILKDAMQKSSEYGSRFLPTEVGFASFVNLIVPNLQKVLLAGWTNERATAAQVVSNDPTWLKRKFFKLHLKFLNEALQAVAMLFPDENLAQLRQAPQFDVLLEKAANSIGLNQEKIDQYRTTPGCAAVNRLATQLVALISLEQDNTSDERLSLRLNRSRQQALLNAGVTSFYPLSSLSNYLVCLDQQSVDGVLEAKVLPKLRSGDLDGLPLDYAPLELKENKSELQRVRALKSYFEGGAKAQVSVLGGRSLESEKTVFLLLDLSGSMGGGHNFYYNQNANVGVESSISILRRSLRETIGKLDDNVSVSIIGFESQAHNLTDGLEKASDLKQPDRLEAVIARCNPMGGTNINCAFNRVSEQIRDIEDYDPNRTMVFFLTDGEFNYGDLANIRSNFERETGLVGAYPLVVGLGINSGANLTQVQQVVEQFNLVEGCVAEQISTQADIPNDKLFVLSDSSGNMVQYFDTILSSFSKLSFEFWRGEINIELDSQIEGFDTLNVDLDELAKLLPFSQLVDGGLDGVENVRFKVSFRLQGGDSSAEGSVEITSEQLDILLKELAFEHSRLKDVEKRTLAPVIERIIQSKAQNVRSLECTKDIATGKRAKGVPNFRGLGCAPYRSLTMAYTPQGGASMPAIQEPSLRRQSTASAARPGLEEASKGMAFASMGFVDFSRGARGDSDDQSDSENQADGGGAGAGSGL